MYAVFLHAHQKIDRTAYRHLKRTLSESCFFPALDQILHFEGHNGPDSTKLKNKKNVEQPWHFIDPFDETDTALLTLIQQHYDELVQALKDRDEVRAAFQSAWLAHALVDGLTPAHHYPYEKELELLRGEDRHSRKGLVGRAYVKGMTPKDSFRRSYQLIGPKGLLTNHAMFEGGAYTIMRPMKLATAQPTAEDLQRIREEGIVPVFYKFAREIGSHDLYRRYVAKGWTPKLVRDIRRELAPRMVQVVTLAWYSALMDAGCLESDR
ncbi:MAG TPA: hypothetical protein VK983_02880 [Candidatus Limnocylindrales bacterium]|nr:hypothetical protein [Candidatus Limnocylindrales bacterium]